jgi:hypothetical protein
MQKPAKKLQNLQKTAKNAKNCKICKNMQKTAKSAKICKKPQKKKICVAGWRCAYMFLYAFNSVWISFSSALCVAESSGLRLDTVRVVVLLSFLPAVWRVVLISIGPAALFFGFFPLAAFPPFVVPFAFFGGISIYMVTFFALWSNTPTSGAGTIKKKNNVYIYTP